MSFHRLNACFVRRKGDNPEVHRPLQEFITCPGFGIAFFHGKAPASWQVPKPPDPLCRGLVSGTIHSCKAHLRNKVLAKQEHSHVQNSCASSCIKSGSTLAYRGCMWLSSQQERILKFCMSTREGCPCCRVATLTINHNQSIPKTGNQFERSNGPRPIFFRLRTS